MQVPVGSGFGASAAAAISAVYAVASATGIKGTKDEIAYHAHVAEIQEQTGLGTVSVSYNFAGAGAIVKPGAPGVSEFVRAKVPRGTKIVTASIGPYRKSDALSNRATSSAINLLGDAALKEFLALPTLDRLAEEGERFSVALGLMTPEVVELAELGKDSGASYASQNMIGLAVHCLCPSGKERAVARALRGSRLRPRVDTFGIGGKKAGVQ